MVMLKIIVTSLYTVQYCFCTYMYVSYTCTVHVLDLYSSGVLLGPSTRHPVRVLSLTYLYVHVGV